MKYDIAMLLSEMLKEAGASELIEGELSNHSTISLNMKNDMPSIMVKEEDDGVWIWSRICDYNESALLQCSANILPLLIDHKEEFFYVGQPCLYVIDSNLELRAKVKNEHLESAEAFSTMLNEYFIILEKYHNALM